MAQVGSRLRGFLRNRWLVFVAAMWMQSVAGVGYLYGSLSPVIKASLGYNQRQVASLGVAKDLGDSVGFLAGTLCAILPLWAALLIGAAQNLVGYGWVWLAVTHRVAVPPLWAGGAGEQELWSCPFIEPDSVARRRMDLAAVYNEWWRLLPGGKWYGDVGGD